MSKQEQEQEQAQGCVYHHSDGWRMARYDDLVRETAYVTRAASDYLGSAADDRSYTVMWQPLADTVGQTIPESKRVVLSPALIPACAPFTGEAVDRIVAVAAHEAGHVRMMRGSTHPSISGHIGHPGRFIMASNIIQDLIIDGPIYRRSNETLGALTASLRADPSDRQQILDYWYGKPEGDLLLKFDPDSLDLEYVAIAALRMWGVARLHGIRLATLPRTPKHRKAWIETFATFDGVADLLDYDNRQFDALADSIPPMYQTWTGMLCELTHGDHADEDVPDPSLSGGSGSGDEGVEDSDDSVLPALCGSGRGSGSGCECEDSHLPDPPAFWSAVEREIRQQDERVRPSGRADLRPFTRKAIVSRIRTALMRAASEPDRSRREESGRIDKRMLPRAMSGRSDTFTRYNDVRVEGKIVLLLDTSGSMTGSIQRLRSVAASIYVALEGTGITRAIYAYGDVNTHDCVCLADDRHVSPMMAQLYANGGTPTREAFATVRARERIVPGINVIVHVTDVDGPVDRVSSDREIARTIADGWHVCNVFFGNVGYNVTGVQREVIYTLDDLPKLVERVAVEVVRHSNRQY
ncbi:MAG: VWA domain-containing protein [Candidatus Micrarchaeota archaeon]|nr:VWA domain-containing protein [Candidatus Micrarchaeota archaeon]